MKLEKLLDKKYSQSINAQYLNLDISGLCCDSRKAKEGLIFIALKGHQYNGHDFIKDAIKKGVSVIMGTEADLKLPEHVCYICVEDTHIELRTLIQKIYQEQSSNVKCIGITGTNGKTTTSYLCEAIIKQSGALSGLIGTVNHRIGKDIFPSLNTTPGLLDNHEFIAAIQKRQGEYCVMEVSSHALAQGRVDMIDFDVAVFTNLTGDHLDYHKTMENYFAAKAKLFVGLKNMSVAIVNGDDPFAKRIKDQTEAKVITYGMNDNNDCRAMHVRTTLDGIVFECVYEKQSFKIHSPLVGKFNVYNVLAAVMSGLAMGFSVDIIQKAIAEFSYVPGRLEEASHGKNYKVFIDYAHTEDALENVCQTLREISDAQLTVVFGCGGDRDRSKRPKMAAAVERWADKIIVTSDNPRTEDPQSIIDEVITGFKSEKYKVLVNREAAIKEAVFNIQDNEVVLIAGKGHEDYQIIGSDRLPFNEKEMVEKYLP